MTLDRRTFLAAGGVAATGLAGTGLGAAAAAAVPTVPRAPAGPLELRFAPYTLQMKHVFTIASNSRTTTETMQVELAGDGLVGYGEASMPPYLGETPDTARTFLSKIDMARYPDPFLVADILADVDAIAPGNHAAKAAFDIALHDWLGKKMGQPWHRIWGLDPHKTPVTSFTIGIDTPDVVRQKVREAAVYKVLKVKLGRDNDREMIETIRGVTDVPIRVDVNQGWRDKAQALAMIEWLATKGVEFVEQPMPKEQVDDLAWLSDKSPLPIVADEAITRLADVRAAYGVYDGVNVKLMKCTGMREAHAMITLARALGMRVMLGCMVESSCAISAAAQLSPLAHWADLDGALLIDNDPFDGATIVDGKVTLSDRPGIGAVERA